MWLLPPLFDHLVVVCARADRNGLVGDVREGEEDLREFLFYLLQSVLLILDLLRDGAQIPAQRLEGLGILLGFALPLVIGRIALVRKRLHGDVELSTLLDQLLERAEVKTTTALLEALHDSVEVGGNVLKFQHGARRCSHAGTERQARRAGALARAALGLKRPAGYCPCSRS